MSTHDELIDTMWELGFVSVDGGDLATKAWELGHPPVENELSSLLFEEREDNLERLETLHQHVVEMFPDATVFKYRHSVDFSHGGRSVSDPSEHIVIQVSNQGVDRPQLRWRQEVEPFTISPRVANGRVFHANGEDVVALDGATGEILWTAPFENVISVPEAGGELVVAAGAVSIRAYDAATGDLQWEREPEDNSESEMLDARLEVGDDTVYAGTRGGDVIAIDAVTGAESVIRSFDGPIYQLLATDSGLLTQTGSGELYALEPDYSIKWTTEEASGARAVRDGTAYCSASGTIQARSLDDGSEIWSQEIGSIRSVSLGIDDLFVVSRDGIHRLDAETGAVTWTCDILAEELMNEFQGVIQLPSGPVVAVDKKSVVHTLDAETGAQRSTFTLGGETSSPVAVDDGAVFVTGPEIIRLEEF